MQLSRGEGLGVVSCSVPFRHILTQDFLPVALLFSVGVCPFQCGGMPFSLWTSSTNRCAAEWHEWWPCCTSLGTGPGWCIVGSVVLSCPQGGSGGNLTRGGEEVSGCQTTARQNVSFSSSSSQVHWPCSISFIHTPWKAQVLSHPYISAPDIGSLRCSAILCLMLLS